MRMQMVVGLMLVGGTAFAQAAADKAPPAAPPAAAKQAPPSPPPELKPPAELAQLKMMVGSWKCDGKGTMNGASMPMKSTYKVAMDLDNFWIVGKTDVPKSKEMPAGYKSVDYYSYDSGAKQFVTATFDTMGAWTTATSKGWDGDKMAWVGKTHVMGMEADMKMTITKKSDKEVALTGETTSALLNQTMELTCKK